jgi:hypothetical protein
MDEEEEEVTTIELKREEGDPKYITLPAEGGVLEITAGDLLINFYTGEVFLPDGTESKISQSLHSLGKDYLRSITVHANTEYIIQLDDGGRRTVKTTEEFKATHQKFTELRITVTAATELRVWASTDPAAGIT